MLSFTLKHSTRASNPEGLLEKELRARARYQEPVGRRYRKRHRKELSAAEVVDVVHSYVIECYSQVEVAKKFRISAQLVSRFVVEARKQPEKLREKKAREKQ